MIYEGDMRTVKLATGVTGSLSAVRMILPHFHQNSSSAASNEVYNSFSVFYSVVPGERSLATNNVHVVFFTL